MTNHLGNGDWGMAANQALNFYENLMSEPNDQRIDFHYNRKIIFDDHFSNMFIAIPNEDKIKTTLFNMPQNKTPGPDGMNVEFLKKNWTTIKG